MSIDGRTPAVESGEYTPNVSGLPHEDRRTTFWNLYSSGRFAESKAFCLACADSPAANPEGERITWASNLSLIERDSGNLHTSLFLLDAVAHLLVFADDRTAGYHHNGRGLTLRLLRRHREAIAAFNRAFTHFNAIEHPFISGVLNNVGRAYSDLKDYGRALESLGRAYELAFGDYVRMGEIKESIALVHEAKGMLREARQAIGDSLSFLANAGDRRALEETWATLMRIENKLAEGRL